MRSRPALWYEARLSVGASTLLLLLGIPAFALLHQVLGGADGMEMRAYEAARAFELILPLSGGLMTAHLMTVEGEAGMAELRVSYPESRWRLPMVRTGVALALVTLAAALGYGSLRLMSGAARLRQLLAPALGPSLLLTGLSLLAGNATQSHWAAAALVMSYWFLEVQTRGELTGPLFLFQYSWPVEQASYALNRWALAGLGTLSFVANAWVSARRKGGKGMGLHADG